MYYTYMSGTSMATPHISGLAAKLWQGNAADTRSYLQSIAKDIWETGDDTATGFGLPIAP
jgi:subtilisin